MPHQRGLCAPCTVQLLWKRRPITVLTCGSIQRCPATRAWRRQLVDHVTVPAGPRHRESVSAAIMGLSGPVADDFAIIGSSGHGSIPEARRWCADSPGANVSPRAKRAHDSGFVLIFPDPRVLDSPPRTVRTQPHDLA